jgi:hypothetical protein
MADVEIINATIPAGATVSAPVGIGFKTVVGFVMPPVWASGALTFRASADGTTFLPCVDTTNTAITISAPAAGTFITIDPKLFAAVNELELVMRYRPGGPCGDRGGCADSGSLTMTLSTISRCFALAWQFAKFTAPRATGVGRICRDGTLTNNRGAYKGASYNLPSGNGKLAGRRAFQICLR